MIVVETNSCPSGQKSMPLLDDNGESGGYQVVIDHAARELFKKADPKLGDLAVVYDKNDMEAVGYAAVLADAGLGPVWNVQYHLNDPNPPVKWIDGVMFVRDASNSIKN